LIANNKTALLCKQRIFIVEVKILKCKIFLKGFRGTDFL